MGLTDSVIQVVLEYPNTGDSCSNNCSAQTFYQYLISDYKFV